MAHYVHLGGLKRMFGHVRVLDPADKSGRPKYERAMWLYKESLKGCSFVIPDKLGWRYLEPKDNADVHEQDTDEFADLLQDMAHAKKMEPFKDFTLEFSALAMASQLFIREKFLRCTTYRLMKCCQLLNITQSPQALFQLLNFIQDGLHEMQIMKLPDPEVETETGMDMKLTVHRDDDVKTIEKPLTVKEGEMKTGVAF